MFLPGLLRNASQPFDPCLSSGPLANGLVFAFNGIHRRNLVNDTAFVTQAGAPAYGAGRRGYGLKGDGTYYATSTTRFIAGSGYTLFALLAGNTAATEGNVYGEDDGGTRNFQFKYDASDVFDFIPFTGGTPLVLQTGTISAADRAAGYAALAKVDKIGNAEVWYNFARVTGSLGGAPNVPSNPNIFERKGAGGRFTGSFLCGFMWARCLTTLEGQAIVANPWQMFRPMQRRIYIDLGGSDVTLTLSGLSMTASAGTPVANNSVALSGLSATSAAGTLVPGTSIALSGLQLTASGGTVTPETGIFVGITGLSMTASYGSLSPALSVALSGTSMTITGGTVTPSGGSIWTAVPGTSSTWTPVGARSTTWTMN